MNQKSTLVFILFFSFCSFAFGDENKQSAKTTNLPAIVHDIATQYHDIGWFSGSVLVIQDDKEIFISSYGFQNIQEKINPLCQDSCRLSFS